MKNNINFSEEFLEHHSAEELENHDIPSELKEQIDERIFSSMLYFFNIWDKESFLTTLKYYFYQFFDTNKEKKEWLEIGIFFEQICDILIQIENKNNSSSIISTINEQVWDILFWKEKYKKYKKENQRIIIENLQELEIYFLENKKRKFTKMEIISIIMV